MYASPKAGARSKNPQQRRPQGAKALADSSQHAASKGTVSLASPSRILPFEIIVMILSQVILDPPSLKKDDLSRADPQTWKMLLLSRSFRSALEPVYYSRVSLNSISALEKFASTLKARPDLNRKVKALWIAPHSLESDFITALKPPADGITALPTQLNQPLAHIRQILRACRSLKHIALDGCLCTRKAADSFGSNCQPLSLVSINPYSFLGGYSSPMFRKLRRLEMCDTSLAAEEVEQVRNLPDLCQFIWTSPREYRDARRDVHSVFRILAPSVRASSLQLAIAGDPASDDPETTSSSLPVKAHQYRHLQSITIRTGTTRSAELGTSLKMAVDEHTKRLQDGGGGDDPSTLMGERTHEDLLDSFASLSLSRQHHPHPSSANAQQASAPYIDSAAHTTDILHPATGVSLHTRPLRDEGLIDEWELLRDLICGSEGGGSAFEEVKRRAKRRRQEAADVSRVASRDREKREQDADQEGRDQGSTEDADEADEIQPGTALRRLWAEWCEKVENGELDVALHP